MASAIVALVLGATTTGRYASLRAFAAAATGALGWSGLLGLGVGTIFVYFAFRPLMRFVSRHLFAFGSLFSRLERRLRTKSQRADNKGARLEQDKRHRLFTRGPATPPR